MSVPFLTNFFTAVSLQKMTFSYYISCILDYEREHTNNISSTKLPKTYI